MTGKEYKKGDQLRGLDVKQLRILASGMTEKSGPFTIDQGTVRGEPAVPSMRYVITVTHRAESYYWADCSQQMRDTQTNDLTATWKAMKTAVGRWLDSRHAAE